MLYSLACHVQSDQSLGGSRGGAYDVRRWRIMVFPVCFRRYLGEGIGPDTGAYNKKGRHPAFVFLVSYLLAFIAALVIAKLLGPHPGMTHAIRRSIFLGFGIAATSFGINYLFGNRSMKLWLVDAGYHVVQFAMIGVVLGLML